jgi:hypothetical protein
MIRKPPTAIELKLEDIAEFEAMLKKDQESEEGKSSKDVAVCTDSSSASQATTATTGTTPVSKNN